jgi:GNAT superfamily N-acetyltransferase
MDFDKMCDGLSLPEYRRACSLSLADALEDNPFYQTITPNFSGDPVRRRAVLGEYFAYSMAEGETLGRCVVLPGDARGAAVWTLPAPAEVQAQAWAAKSAFLASILDPAGYANYLRILDFMAPRAGQAVGKSAWYLSILGVSPHAQGQGLGSRLLQPTLLEADRAGIPCYLETFSRRNIPFYERLGFVRLAAYLEPVTEVEYWIMVRETALPKTAPYG